MELKVRMQRGMCQRDNNTQKNRKQAKATNLSSAGPLKNVY